MTLIASLICELLTAVCLESNLTLKNARYLLLHIVSHTLHQVVNGAGYVASRLGSPQQQYQRILGSQQVQSRRTLL